MITYNDDYFREDNYEYLYKIYEDYYRNSQILEDQINSSLPETKRRESLDKLLVI